jgi:hypothetical protein
MAAEAIWIVRPCAEHGTKLDHDFIGVDRRGIGGIGVPRLKPSGA